MIRAQTPWHAQLKDEDADAYLAAEDEEGIGAALDAAFGGKVETTPSEFTEFSVRVPYKGDFIPFRFEERRYLRTIYDCPSPRRILMAGRQVEKTLRCTSNILVEDGSFKQAGEVEVGDWVACLSLPTGVKTTSGKVGWVSKRYFKPCVRIRTRQGHQCEVATTHPMRLMEAWVEAGNLRVGTRLGIVRRAGDFLNEEVNATRLKLTAYMIADGSLGQQDIRFTKGAGVVQDEFLGLLKEIGMTYREDLREGTSSNFGIHTGVLHEWLKEDGLKGCLSPAKFVPQWVFQLSRKDTALFLNRLWSCDGHVKKVSRSKYDFVYSSISLRLVRQVQALLWKFGIPTDLRSYKPEVYEGTEKEHHLLRIETQRGISTFLTEIGALGKSEGVPLPDLPENNNRDTYPIEINGLITDILESKAGGLKSEWRGRFFAAGLRRTLKYPPTRDKLAEYMSFFEGEGGFDEKLLEDLALHLDTDIYWDELEAIDYIGEQECVDFMVEDHHNFICDGFFTHNSTLLGNQSLSYSCINPAFRTLYVAPSHQQTKTFSNDRVKEPIELSAVLKAFAPASLISNILERKFANRSQITFRFAFLNADRCRGVATDHVLVDEFQDILLDNIPVIEECASHSAYRFFTYAGTPKSLDGSLEHYWSRYSTQNEWVVPCRNHGTPKDPASWHWNVLTEESIGPDGLCCDKCRGPIDAKDADATWASMNPSPKVEKPFEGFRIPQLMVPWIEWSDILHKQKNYPRAKFYNEVLGRSFDSGTRPLARQDIIDNCNPKLSMRHYKKVASKWAGQVPIFMGLDWGSGENSYTVVTLGGYLPFDPNFFTFFYYKRFEGIESEPKVQLETIKRLVRDFNVTHIGADYGGGHWPNDELLREFGAEKLHKYQWVGNVKKKIKWDPQLGVPRFLCHRTEVMSDFFNAMKRKNTFRFPRWEEMHEPFGTDFLNVISEYNERLRMNVFKHPPGYPDDSCHASIFGFLASFYYRKRPDVILPTREVDRELRAAAEHEDEELDIT